MAIARCQQWVEPDAVFADIAGEIKRAVKVPVIANGRIKTPAVAARVITEGKADLVSMSRRLDSRS